ncbi:MAG: glycosyltransferase family 2 protein [Candidatus Daviesbacteria bacterium]
MKNKRQIAILIPAYNEEKLLIQTLKSLLKIVSKQDIYLVDDCSTDKTAKIAQKYLKHILSLEKNQGKAQSLNKGIEYFDLIKKYQYIFPIDADTKIEPDFIKKIINKFNLDKKIVAVVGKICGTDRSWITSYRLWEYEIGQSLHKNAQEKEGAIVVCPGCTTVYKSQLFQKVKFPFDTQTEDMDLTFQIHRQKLGKIVLCPEAKALTQDPLTLKDFIKQQERWYTGYWQCVQKHKIPFGKQMLDFEVALASTEGLFGCLLTLAVIIFSPLIITLNPFLLISGLAIDFFLFFIPSIYLTCFKNDTLKLFKYLPHFYFLRFLASLIFLKSFSKTLLGLDKQSNWNKVTRYSFQGA